MILKGGSAMYGSWTENVVLLGNFLRIHLRHIRRFNSAYPDPDPKHCLNES